VSHRDGLETHCETEEPPVHDDPREAAARYRAARDGDDDAAPPEPTPDAAAARVPTAADRAAYVETAIAQAIRRGDFDGLPGAGKPLENLGAAHDPDWWIRRKIEREQLRGLGPPALALRVEDRELDTRLDAFHREADVREALEDFNRRVRAARMQLLGGPPVVTALRDVDAEVARWHERRRAQGADRPATERTSPPRRRRGFLRGWRSSN
jgi:hypothetical protein